MNGLIGALLARRILAGIVVSAITLIVMGGVVLTMTSAGCGPAKALHIKSIENHCALLTAAAPSPSPTKNPYPWLNPTPTDTQPTQPPASNPFPGPVSNPNPPYNPGASAGNPYPDSSSGNFPPFGNPASGAGGQTLLSCRLPVYAGGPGSGGFISFPGGNFTADPRSAVTVPSPSPGTPSPPPQMGQYQGWWGTTYDRAYSRWLPVPFAWVTPDGTRYAYPGQTGGVYVQNISNGTEVELGDGKVWTVIDVEATGVYAVTGASGGLWFLNFSGTVTQVIATGYWQAVAAGFGFGTPTSSVPNGAGNTIMRLDLSNGTTTDYFSRQGVQSYVQGFDPAGNPVIYVQGLGGVEIWIGTAPNVATEIANLNGSNFYPNGPLVSDIHGLWIGGSNGIALHVTGAGWYAMSNIGGQLAGGCY
jgi:hypothetical protein